MPKSLKVGMPNPLGRVLFPVWTDENALPADLPGLEGEWVAVSGGPLPMRALVRIDRAKDDRLMITGLILGWRDRQEITWQTLRQVKPATLLEWIFAGFDPHNPAKDAGESRGMAVLSLWEKLHMSAEQAPIDGRSRATAAPDLQAFADAYRRHLAAHPHRAMTATADELKVSRATAIRRADQCRRVGLLPPKEGTR